MTEPPVAAVYQIRVSPTPTVAEPVLAVLSKQAVTLVPAGASGNGLMVTDTNVRGPSHPVAVTFAPA
ncbi:hypothetical protein FUMI01_25470 [Flavobacterium sp. UMI-01]|nr:hypothetical protein FUMI01_25470 [Flavobacterium sp. UMI-01]